MTESALGNVPDTVSIDPILAVLLGRRLAARDRPTPSHHTLEIAAYWKDDFVDAVRAGVRRRLTIGGLRSAGRANLAVELAPPLRAYTVARIQGRQARIIFPSEAGRAVQRADGTLDGNPLVEPERRAPFAAMAFLLGFDESFAFKVNTLTFLCRFVHRDGRPRHSLDWIPAAIFSGYLGDVFGDGAVSLAARRKK